MVKKYIVELESGTHIFVLGPEGITHIGEPDVVYETVDGMQIGDAVINAKPYTEPDLEQVRKEAYDEGYDDVKGGYENGFENGMIVAWEAARKISSMNSFTRDEIFGLVITSNILDENTAAEVIEKLKAYEQKQKREEEQIQVGDEVRNIENRWTAVVCNIDRECMTLMDTNGALGDGYNVNRFTKTGRHFPEIAEVLEKMRGEQDG